MYVDISSAIVQQYLPTPTTLLVVHINSKALHKKSAETNSMGSPLICNTGFLYTQKRVMMCYQQLI